MAQRAGVSWVGTRERARPRALLHRVAAMVDQGDFEGDLSFEDKAAIGWLVESRRKADKVVPLERPGPSDWWCWRWLGASVAETYTFDADGRLSAAVISPGKSKKSPSASPSPRLQEVGRCSRATFGSRWFDPNVAHRKRRWSRTWSWW